MSLAPSIVLWSETVTVDAHSQVYSQLAQLPRSADACTVSEGTERGGISAIICRAVGRLVRAFE